MRCLSCSLSSLWRDSVCLGTVCCSEGGGAAGAAALTTGQSLRTPLHVQLEMEVRTYPWSKLINTGQGLSLPIVVLALVCPPRWSDKLGEKRVESLPGGKFLLQWNHSFSQLCPYPAWDPGTILILLVPCFSGLIA